MNHFPLCLWKVSTAVILLTVGCAPQLFWAKSGARPGDFEEDVSQCKASLTSGSREENSETFPLTLRISDDALEQCLMAKGWILAEKP
jgi:hypothetical protein